MCGAAGHYPAVLVDLLVCGWGVSPLATAVGTLALESVGARGVMLSLEGPDGPDPGFHRDTRMSMWPSSLIFLPPTFGNMMPSKIPNISWGSSVRSWTAT